MGSQFPAFYSSPGNPWGTPPGINDPEYKVLTNAGAPNSIYISDVVKVSVVPGQFNTIKVDWPVIPGAVNYTVFRGFSLFFSQAQAEPGPIAANTYTFQFKPSIPTDMVMNVWVQANFAIPTPPALVQAEPASTERLEDYFARANNPLETSYSNLVADNDYMRFIASEIRRRAITMIQNDGEWFTLYIRRWSGTRCNCNETEGNLLNGPDVIQGEVIDPTKGIGTEPDLSADPQNDALARCPRCYGTGIIGGYYYGIPTYMRYGNLPQRQIIFKNFAIDIPHNFNTWTLWEPKLHTHDVVHRQKTGEYFEVGEAARGEWRAVPFHQECNLKLLPPGDHRYKVTTAAIQAVGG